MTLNEFVSVVALASGVSALVLGILNHLRDRHKIIVTLHWDRVIITADPGNDPKKLWGVVTVTNAGRRAAYITGVALEDPKGSCFGILLDSIQGKRLAEGDAPLIFQVPQDDMVPYAKDWRRIVARVEDFTGKVWFSKKLKSKHIPSWAKPRS